MEEQRPRVGMIGGGFMAETHTRAARAAGAIPVGLASSSPESAARNAERLGYRTAFASPRELIDAPDIDVVHVCTPNTTHADLAGRALEAGKHVICEKPLATDLDDAATLVGLARDSGLVAAVPFVYRFHPMVRQARTRIASGITGRLLSVRGAYLQDWLLSPDDDNWRVDTDQGGPSRAFADIGSHLCDLIEFATGDRIVRVAAAARTVFDERAHNRRVATEDLVTVNFETASGALGSLLVSQVAPGRKNQLSFEISGSVETVAFDQEEPNSLWIGRRDGSIDLARDAATLDADAARLSFLPAGHPLGYQDAFNAFVHDAYAAITGRAPEGLPTFDDGLRAVAVTEAVLRSAATDGWATVPTGIPVPTP